MIVVVVGEEDSGAFFRDVFLVDDCDVSEEEASRIPAVEVYDGI